MRKKTGAAFAILIVSCLATTEAQKNKTPNVWPCMLTFRDAHGDAIRSDGKGPYVHGQDTVNCAVVPPDSGSLTEGDVSLYFDNKPGRALYYAEQSGNGSHPGWKAFYDRGSFRVKQAAHLAPGESGYRPFISYSGVGRFIASRESENDPIRDLICVERSAGGCTWNISFDPAVAPESGNALMELWDGNGWSRYRGAFQMPTGMQVTLLTCPHPLQP